MITSILSECAFKQEKMSIVTKVINMYTYDLKFKLHS